MFTLSKNHYKVIAFVAGSVTILAVLLSVREKLSDIDIMERNRDIMSRKVTGRDTLEYRNMKRDREAMRRNQIKNIQPPSETIVQRITPGPRTFSKKIVREFRATR